MCFNTSPARKQAPIMIFIFVLTKLYYYLYLEISYLGEKRFCNIFFCLLYGILIYEQSIPPWVKILDAAGLKPGVRYS